MKATPSQNETIFWHVVIVENYELFKQYLVVERDASDPNRLNTLFPPDYVNQLRVFAVVNQFRLQYSEESA